MIRLVDPLVEPEFYCIDVPGDGKNVQLEAPLMAHTLKRFGSADEMWIMNYPGEGQIYSKAYERCIEVESTTSGANLLFKKPRNFPLQRFSLTETGTLVLVAHPEHGVAVATDLAALEIRFHSSAFGPCEPDPFCLVLAHRFVWLFVLLHIVHQ